MFLKVKATEGVNTIIKASSKAANRYNNNQIASEHILYGLTFDANSISGAILSEYGITDKLVLSVLEQSKTHDNTINSKVELTKKAEHLFKIAGEVSEDLGSPFMGTEHVLFALLTEKDSIAITIIEQVFNVEIQKLKHRLANVLGLDENNALEKEQFNNNISQASSNLPEELLAMGTDVTLKAVDGKIDPIIGRDEETKRIIEILCRKGKNNPILIGKPGVGKSAVVEGLAQKIVKGQVPESLQNKIVYSLDIGSLMAGTRYRGALEEKLKNAIDIIIKSTDIILFIDEIHTIMQAGGDKGEVSPADMLKPYLARGELQTIGATTIDEYKKFIEKDKALERRFQQVMVNPPTVEQTIQILNGLKAGYENYHKVSITSEAIEAAVKLSDRYVTDRNLPDKAIDLIDEASSKGRVSAKALSKIINEKHLELEKLIEQKSRVISSQDFNEATRIRDQIYYKQQELYALEQKESESSSDVIIDEEQIAKVIATWTGVPVSKLTENEKEKLLNLEEELHKRIIGQHNAVVAVSKAIRRARVGLKDKNRPIGSFIFVGQTGTGKTELCKALAQYMFDDENAMIRLDMSEYMEAHSVSKLIGAPAGYVGYDDGGVLTDAVKRKPYSVILFDEIEKAHKDVFNIMLQMLEDGKLTDNKGNIVNFKNTIIIFTSNAGINKLPFAKQQSIRQGLEFTHENMREVLLESLKDYFRPEFLNRIDTVAVFEPFKMEELAKIAKIIITKLNAKLKQKNLSLKITESAFKYLILKGTNDEYGARPLRRVIEQEIEDKLSEDLLNSKLQENSTIIINLENDVLSFNYMQNDM